MDDIGRDMRYVFISDQQKVYFINSYTFSIFLYCFLLFVKFLILFCNFRD